MHIDSESCIKEEKTFFWAGYILYIILGLVAIILTGMVLRGGTKHKAIIWTLYAFNLLAFIGVVVLLAMGHKIFGGILLFVQFILSLSALIITNNSGNIATSTALGNYVTVGKYTAAVVFTIMALLVGIPAVYFNQAITST